jgi:predicted lipoprotein with Yx(FWY)xxD motif
MNDQWNAAKAMTVTVPCSAKRRIVPLLWVACSIGWSLTGCRGDDSATTPETGGSAGAAGTAAAGDAAGSNETGGGGASGGVGTGGSTTGGQDAETDGAVADDGGTTALPLCVFHTDTVLASEGADDTSDGGVDEVSMPDDVTPDAVSDDSSVASDGSPETSDGASSTSDGGSSREASSARDASGDARSGDAGPTSTISLQTSAFIGRYLADGAGRTLYIYAGDLPGDCNDAPVSNCDSTLATAKCADAWPIFEGLPRTLSVGLSDDAFGTILRADGLHQATYYGWPLYYYKNDTMPLLLAGQNKAKSWWAATVIPPAVVIMKDASATPQKYVAEGTGRTLYTFAQDTKGTDQADPVSACRGACLDNYKPFQRSRLSVVTSLEPTDFSIFVRSDGKGQQVAYKGAPLYLAAGDVHAGQMSGVGTDWAIILQ